MLGTVLFNSACAIAVGSPVYANLGVTPLALILHVGVLLVWLFLQWRFQAWHNFEFEMTLMAVILALGVSVVAMTCTAERNKPDGRHSRPYEVPIANPQPTYP